MRTALRLAAAVAGLLLSSSLAAVAGDVTVTIKDQRGAPVPDAVVMLQYPGGKVPPHYAQPLQMDQRDLMFSPLVLVVPVGADVKFNNEDKVRHHVYSFSPAKKFELKLFGKDQSHSIRFDKVGTVALGCNIHDGMVSFIKVVDTPFAIKTDASGRVVIHDVPAGAVAVKVWQPYLRGPDNEIGFNLAVPKSGGVQHDVFAPINAPKR